MSTVDNAYLNLVNSASSRQLHKDDLKYIPKPYKDVAGGMEKQFAEFMINQMNKTTGEQSSDDGMDYYKSLLTEERAKTLTQSGGGLGLQKLILDQIYPQKFRNEHAYHQYEKQANALNKNKAKIERHDYPKMDIDMAHKEVTYE